MQIASAADCEGSKGAALLKPLLEYFSAYLGDEKVIAHPPDIAFVPLALPWICHKLLPTLCYTQRRHERSSSFIRSVPVNKTRCPTLPGLPTVCERHSKGFELA